MPWTLGTVRAGAPYNWETPIYSSIISTFCSQHFGIPPIFWTSLRQWGHGDDGVEAAVLPITWQRQHQGLINHQWWDLAPNWTPSATVDLSNGEAQLNEWRTACVHESVYTVYTWRFSRVQELPTRTVQERNPGEAQSGEEQAKL